LEFGFTGDPPMPGWSEHAALKVTFWKSGQIFYIDGGTIDGIANHPLPFGLYMPWAKLTTPDEVAKCRGGWYERRTDPLTTPKGNPGFFPSWEVWKYLLGW
ncbi:MAG: hypothetical protein KF708_23375, partial [Pirellulales bacterium]|nr:hypothetical protein [Pirellulales bacterium]